VRRIEHQPIGKWKWQPFKTMAVCDEWRVKSDDGQSRTS